MNNGGMDRKTDESSTWKTVAGITKSNETNNPYFYYLVLYT